LDIAPSSTVRERICLCGDCFPMMYRGAIAQLILESFIMKIYIITCEIGNVIAAGPSRKVQLIYIGIGHDSAKDRIADAA
jgi:hypothetical protein